MVRHKTHRREPITKSVVHVFSGNIGLILGEGVGRTIYIKEVIDATISDHGRDQILSSGYYTSKKVASRVLRVLIRRLTDYCQSKELYQDITIFGSFEAHHTNRDKAAAVVYLQGQNNYRLAKELEEAGNLEKIVMAYSPVS